MATFAALACFAAYFLGYRFYAKRLADKVFRLDPNAITPAHELKDGFDYVPSRKPVLFGHHFASIAGLSPMLGPAIAVIWGWLPAMIWVVLGTLFVGAVHDFSALVVSMRAKGVSIGKVAETVIGPRAKSLFHVIIFFLIALAMGVFVQIVAQLFSSAFYPESVFPSFVLMALALAMGFLYYKKGFPLGLLTGAAFLLTLGAVFWSLHLPRPDFSVETWSVLLLVYSFLAAVLPVWFLLQPRDFLNSLLLYLGLAAIYGGFFVLRPEFVAPAIEIHPEGAPPLFPFVFIVIACGAISGFHGLVSSGTSARQIDKETDATFIGYGAMMAESLLGLAAILVCTAGFIDADSWREHYQSWNVAQGLARGMTAFIDGSALFLSQLGIPREAGRTFIALMAVFFRSNESRFSDPSPSLQHSGGRGDSPSAGPQESLFVFRARRGRHRFLRFLQSQWSTGRPRSLGALRHDQPDLGGAHAAHGDALSHPATVELSLRVDPDGLHAGHDDRGHDSERARFLQFG